MIVSETWSRGRRRSIACRGRDRGQGPRRQEEDGGADQALPGRPPAAPQLAKITSHILQLNKSWRAGGRLGGGRAGPGRRRRLPPASSVLVRGLSRDKLWNAVAPYSTFRLRSHCVKRCLPRSSCVIRCLPNTLLTCRNVPGSHSAFLCRVKGHTLTLCARRRGSLGTRLLCFTPLRLTF